MQSDLQQLEKVIMEQTEKKDGILPLVIDLSGNNISLPSLSIKTLAYIEKLEGIINKYNAESPLSDVAAVVCYIWADEAKQVALLMRDCLLKLLALRYQEIDGLKLPDQAEQYRDQVKEVITKASHDLDQSLRNIQDGQVAKKGEWKHETNPAETVLSQLNVLENQVKKIQRSQHKLDDINHSFEEYRKSIQEAISQRKADVEENQKILAHILEELKSTSIDANQSDIEKLIIDIEKYIDHLQNRPENRRYESIQLKDMDEVVIPVNSIGGRLQYKTIDILSEVSSWSSLQVLGPLRSTDIKLSTYGEKVNMALFNLANRLKAKVEEAEGGEINFAAKEMSKSLKKIDKDYNDMVQANIMQSLDSISEDISSQINVSNLYNEQYDFLPVTKIGKLTSSLTYKQVIKDRYDIEQFKKTFHQWTRGYFTREKSIKNTSATEYIESIINVNTEDENNAIFLRKGLLGSSFTVPRPIKEAAIEKHFELWKKGFGGALLISGDYGSGKSTLLEQITLKYSKTLGFNLALNHTIDIKGYKMKTEADISKTIREIIRRVDDDETCILAIDDLQQYARSPQTMYDLMLKLLPLIQKNNQKIYFAVSIDHQLLKRLRSHFDIDNVFTEIINTNDISPLLIEDALKMRAFAIADHDDSETSNEQINNRAHKIAKRSKGNIGHAMYNWCRPSNEEEFNPNKLFQNSIKKHRLLLETIAMYEKLFVPDLAKMYDKVELANIKSDISYLTRQKMLIGHKGGFVSLNPNLRHHVNMELNLISQNLS